MMIEDASLRSIYMQDFGQDVTINGTGYSAKTIKAIFDNEYEGVVGESIEFATSSPRIVCVSADITDLKYGDTVEVDSSTYKAVTIMPDGTGMTEVMLELQ